MNVIAHSLGLTTITLRKKPDNTPFSTDISNYTISHDSLLKNSIFNYQVEKFNFSKLAFWKHNNRPTIV